MKLQRHTANPILQPDPTSDWEALNVFNPAVIPKEPIFEPEELWELNGDVPNVVFSAANSVVQDTVHVYYGAADHVIGLATCNLEELLDYAQNG